VDAGGVEGNILIADQLNNRVIEVTRAGDLVWTFGDGSSVAGPTSVVAPNDAERLDHGRTLIAAGGGSPSCGPTMNCDDSRVIIVEASGGIAWTYGQPGVLGSGVAQLRTPVAAVMLASANVLITDSGNHRVIEVAPNKTIAWQYGQTGVMGLGANQLSGPSSAERLPSSHTLIADSANNRVIEVDLSGKLIWQHPAAIDLAQLSSPAFASRLPNGNTLIADSLNSRVIEVTPKHDIAWSYVTNTEPGSAAQPQPTRAVRLANGDTLIADQFNHRVIEVDPTGKAIVFAYGKLNVPGSGANRLYAPFDAKVVGDFTGLTPFR
jgi:hypothetical protein